MSVQTGLDRLVEDGCKQLSGLKIGLLANQASVDRKFRHIADILHESRSCRLLKIFAPEHGFRGELQDMATVGNAVDQKTGLPVISLYGATEASLTPQLSDLDDLDALVVDLPDIGTRYYTFAQSLGYAMKAARAKSIKIFVIDRPNPISGAQVEGSGLSESCRSFCGYAPVVQRHGLTLGELAELMQQGFGIGEDRIPAISCDLEVLKVSGWTRDMYFDDTGLPWVIPSPNMPTLETAIVYPGGCLFEATSLSEGRGTTKPFEFVGAPGVHPERWIDAAMKQGIVLDGCHLRPITFQPQFQKHRGQVCGGVQIHITQRRLFRPFRAALALLFALKHSHAAAFAWRSEAYEFISTVPPIDLLYGNSHLREALESGEKACALLPEIEECESSFLQARRDFLLY
ncbi:MAG: DUF1343 domain-containing protein [Bdellovibrionota bacterium]